MCEKESCVAKFQKEKRVLQKFDRTLHFIALSSLTWIARSRGHSLAYFSFQKNRHSRKQDVKHILRKRRLCGFAAGPFFLLRRTLRVAHDHRNEHVCAYPYAYPGDSTRFTGLWKPRILLLTPPYVTRS